MKRSFGGPRDPQSIPSYPPHPRCHCKRDVQHSFTIVDLLQIIYLQGHDGPSAPIPWCGQPSPELIFSYSPNAGCTLCFGLVLSSGGLVPSGGNSGTGAFIQGSEVLPQTNSTLASYLGRWHLEVPGVTEGPCPSSARSFHVSVCPLLQGSSLPSVPLLRELLLGMDAACLGRRWYREGIARKSSAKSIVFA